jgi:hypothetical protein
MHWGEKCIIKNEIPGFCVISVKLGSQNDNFQIMFYSASTFYPSNYTTLYCHVNVQYENEYSYLIWETVGSPYNETAFEERSGY